MKRPQSYQFPLIGGKVETGVPKWTKYYILMANLIGHSSQKDVEKGTLKECRQCRSDDSVEDCFNSLDSF